MGSPLLSEHCKGPVAVGHFVGHGLACGVFGMSLLGYESYHQEGACFAGYPYFLDGPLYAVLILQLYLYHPHHKYAFCEDVCDEGIFGECAGSHVNASQKHLK